MIRSVLRCSFVLSLGAASATTSIGCISVKHGKTEVDGTGGSGSGSSGTGAVGGAGTGGSAGGAGGDGTSAGGSGPSAGGGPGAGGGEGDGGDLPPPPSAPVIESAEAHVAGRGGDDIVISMNATDGDADAELVFLRLLTVSGDPIVAFDTDWEGTPDASETRRMLDRSPSGELRFSGSVTLAGFASRFPDAARVLVRLDDATGQSSPEQTLDIAPQELRSEGDACDVLLVRDRCAAGQSCGGDPAVCVAASPPAITQIAYLRSSEGPRLLVVGSDADDDLATLHLEFLTAAGAKVEVDWDGDQIPNGSTFDLNVTGVSKGGLFFVKNQMGLAFDLAAQKIAATPIDGQALSGEEMTASITNATARRSGESCDPRGFDACPGSDVCARETAGDGSVCTARVDIREARCQAAPVLDPSAGATRVFLRAEDVSTWDPPVGCASPYAITRPEAVARLRVAAPARIKLSTALPETQADTVLYVLSGCSADGATAAACQDDGRGSASEITLDFEPGDYIVIADSARELGGAVGLEAVVQ